MEVSRSDYEICCVYFLLALFVLLCFEFLNIHVLYPLLSLVVYIYYVDNEQFISKLQYIQIFSGGIICNFKERLPAA